MKSTNFNEQGMNSSNISISDWNNDNEIPVQLRIMWLVFGLITMSLNVCAALALCKCKNIVLQIRIISINLTGTEIVFGVYISTVQVLRMVGIHAPCRLKWYIQWAIYLSRGIFVAFLALDRFCCLYMAMRYARYVSKRLVHIVCLLAWIFSLTVCAQMFITVPDKEQYFCQDVQKMKNNEIVSVAFLLCVISVIVAYIGIYINVKKHERQLGNLAYKSTMKILVIVLGFLLSSLPGYCYNLYIWIKPDMIYKTEAARQIVFVLVCIGSVATPFLYVLRFKDCRAQLVSIFCFLDKTKYKRKQSQLKISIAPYLRAESVPCNSIAPVGS